MFPHLDQSTVDAINRAKGVAKEKAKADQQFNDERFQLATESAGIGVWEYNIQDKFIRWDSATQMTDSEEANKLIQRAAVRQGWEYSAANL
jgi:hypothetical protein